jgi:sporulation protein YlmC with PRC-barrel domain
MRLQLGDPVRSSDREVVGELADVIIRPTEQRVTHLVVKPHNGDHRPHLIPIELAVSDAGPGSEISLRCDSEEVGQLPNVEDFAYLPWGEAPVSDAEWDVGVRRMLALPYYDGGPGTYAGPFDQNVGILYDRIPKGEVEVRRSSRVVSADGHDVGDLAGFVVDADDRLTHVVLLRGHLWRRRTVTIPISLIASVETDIVTVVLSRDGMAELPAHKVHHRSLGRFVWSGR